MRAVSVSKGGRKRKVMAVFPFGKYRGEKVSTCWDIGYVLWFAENVRDISVEFRLRLYEHARAYIEVSVEELREEYEMRAV